MVWKRVALNALKFAGSRDQSTKNKEINALEKKQTFVERLRNDFGINGKLTLTLTLTCMSSLKTGFNTIP